MELQCGERIVAGKLSSGQTGKGRKVWEEGLSLSMRAVGNHGVFERETKTDPTVRKK